jgi:valyl-tRNA synthetase
MELTFISQTFMRNRRNFANKIECLPLPAMKKGQFESEGSADQSKDYTPDIFDKWIESRLNSTIRDYFSALSEYKINEASRALYDFIWRDFCDWYIELIKITLQTTQLLMLCLITRL